MIGTDHRVYCWGFGEEGLRKSPIVMPSLGVAEDLAGGALTCALQVGGTVRCVNRLGETKPAVGDFGPDPSPWVDVRRLGGSHVVSCAVTQLGTLSCLGVAFAELGMPKGATFFARGPELMAHDKPVPLAIPGKASAVVLAGTIPGHHACVLRDDRTLACWGENGAGQVGDGTVVERALPVVLGLRDVRSVALGVGSSCALDGAATVWCWGAVVRQTSPTPVPELATSTAIAVSGDFGVCGVMSGVPRCLHEGQTKELKALKSAVELVPYDEYLCARDTQGRGRCLKWGLGTAFEVGLPG